MTRPSPMTRGLLSERVADAGEARDLVDGHFAGPPHDDHARCDTLRTRGVAGGRIFLLPSVTA